MSYTSPIIASIEDANARKDIPEFRAGDTIKVHARISEGGKERIQIFEGVCIHRKRGGARGSFTVRKVSHGVGVERVFMEGSNRVTQVELVTRGKVRRAKLYYLRGLRGNAARIRAKLGNYASVLTAPEPEPIVPELAEPAEADADAKTEAVAENTDA